MAGKRIASIGECMVELSDIGNNCYQRSFAGDTLNTAVYLARGLRPTKHQVSYVTALGDDTLSEMMLDGWKKEGIACAHVGCVPDLCPGLYYIQLADSGERSFCYWRSDSAAKQLFKGGLSEHQINSLCHDFDVLYLSGITLGILDAESQDLFIACLETAKNNGAQIVFDTNYRPRLWPSRTKAQDIVDKVLSLATMALVTFDDEHALFDDLTPEDTLRRLGNIPEVVVKNGEDGCLVRYQGETVQVPAMTVSEVVDTTAAGDSFNGGYLAARIQDASVVQAAKSGHALAATVIQHKGAIISEDA